MALRRDWVNSTSVPEPVLTGGGGFVSSLSDLFVVVVVVVVIDGV
jgi:hypothetical protein